MVSATLELELLPGQEALHWGGTELPEAVKRLAVSARSMASTGDYFGSIREIFWTVSEERAACFWRCVR
jgi:hypothetical protein